ncbi:hypothetical protein BH24GEM1_BH24GEM1_11560 [soil metagenome]
MRRFLPLNPDAALLILRVVLGVIMLYHGWPKLTNLGGTIEGFSGMGVPLPALSAVFATVAEVGGGLLLLFGVLTDVAGLLIAMPWRWPSRWQGREGTPWGVESDTPSQLFATIVQSP